MAIYVDRVDAAGYAATAPQAKHKENQHKSPSEACQCAVNQGHHLMPAKVTSYLAGGFWPYRRVTWVSSGYTKRSHNHWLNYCWLLLVVHHLRLLRLLVHDLIWCVHLRLLLLHINGLLLGQVLRRLLVHSRVNGFRDN